MNFTLVLGGPGTGKTEAMIARVSAALKAGVRPDQVAFVAFSKAAAEEAAARAGEALSLSRRELPHFRTLHSLCFKELGLRRGDVVEGASARELEKLTGERFGRQYDTDAVGPFEVEQLARATGRDPAALARELLVDRHRFQRAIAAYAAFKEDKGLLDFTDMLEQYQADGKPLPDIRLAIVDEAQDLTPLQWKVVRRAFAQAQEVVVAGDDDQAIHEWAGATVAPMIHHRGTVEVLSQSHRLPRAVHALAQKVVARIKARQRKDTAPSDREGAVSWLHEPHDCTFSSGTWLLLARARYQLDELVSVCRVAGVPYTVRGRSSVNQDLLDKIKTYEGTKQAGAPAWHDALTSIPLEEREYLLACRRRGERLNGPPRIAIETVHGSKGRQADHVLLCTDLTARVSRAAEAQPDPELRVCYVGVTRARETLSLVEARGIHRWQL